MNSLKTPPHNISYPQIRWQKYVQLETLLGMRRTKLFLTFSILTLCQMISFGQNNIAERDTAIYTAVDKNPVLIANDRHYKLDKIDEFIKQNLVCPVDPDDCQGRVYISIIIEKDGTVKHKEFVRKLCDRFDENSMKVIDLMTKWTPGFKNGNPVRTKLILHVTWKLE